jgi:nucleotide-binding universal stress UspA family protein
MAQDTAPGRPQNLAGQVRAAAPVIVVGVDGSPTGWDAFAWAAEEAKRLGDRLLAVYVMSSADPAAAFGASFDYAGVEQAKQAVAAELRDEAAHRAGRLGLSVSFVSECGDATRVLAGVARSVHADVIVVGRSTKALHRLAGSLSHRLTSRKDAPVVVVVP